MLHNLSHPIENLRSPAFFQRVVAWVQANRFMRVLDWLAPFLNPDRRRLLAVAD